MNLTYTRSQLEERWPRQHAKAVAAVKRLTAERVMACKHVVDGALAGLCAEHPAAGLLCWAGCLLRHARRHPRDLELTCDECGEVRYSIRGAAVFWPVPDPLEVRDTRSCRRRIDGFVVVALGVCGACSRAASAASA